MAACRYQYIADKNIETISRNELFFVKKFFLRIQRQENPWLPPCIKT
jgi:hypothetical protein